MIELFAIILNKAKETVKSFKDWFILLNILYHSSNCKIGNIFSYKLYFKNVSWCCFPNKGLDNCFLSFYINIFILGCLYCIIFFIFLFFIYFFSHFPLTEALSLPIFRLRAWIWRRLTYNTVTKSSYFLWSPLLGQIDGGPLQVFSCT